MFIPPVRGREGEIQKEEGRGRNGVGYVVWEGSGEYNCVRVIA